MSFENKSRVEKFTTPGHMIGTIDSEGNETDPDILALIKEVKSMQDNVEISPEAKSVADELLKKLSQK